MVEFDGGLPADPLARTDAVVRLSDCFLTHAALRSQLEKFVVAAAGGGMTAKEKEATKSQALGEAAITNYGGCGLALDTNGDLLEIVPCIRPEEDCPLRHSSINEYGGEPIT